MTTAGSRPQRTLARNAEVRGIGYLQGSDVCVRFRPAAPDAGIVFVRTDLPGRPSVPARVSFVEPRERRTTLKRGQAVVEMVEHVLAALSGLRIDNCLVEIDAAETPGCDGSALAFARAIAAAGTVEQDRPREVLRLEHPVTVRDGLASLAAYGGESDRLVLSYQLDYGQGSPIPSQSYFLDLTPERFLDEIAPSRTFLLAAEAEAMRAAGIGSRTSEADLLIFGPDGPIGNALRFPDECARHKLLDVIGDLALLGKDLAGHIVAHRSGHSLNAGLARALLAARTGCGVQPGRFDNDNDNDNDTAAPEPSSIVADTPEPAMDINAILKLLPHRYPFLLIDRVLEIAPGRSLRALKNVSCNEPFFPGHWPSWPVMPGVMIVEAMAQAAGILICERVDPRECLALLVSIDEVRLRRPVIPGDQLVLEITQFRARSKMAEARGIARVGGQLAAEAKLRFAILPSASPMPA